MKRKIIAFRNKISKELFVLMPTDFNGYKSMSTGVKRDFEYLKDERVYERFYTHESQTT